MPFPISKLSSVKPSYITGVFILDSLTYAGPSYSANFFIKILACMSSDGEITNMFGIVLIKFMSSNIWCVAPSSPTVIPACVPTIFTFKFGYAILQRI